MTAANHSSRKTISCYVKGDGKNYRLMIFARQLGFMPATPTFVAGPQWAPVSMNLTDFDGVDGRDIIGILWTGEASRVLLNTFVASLPLSAPFAAAYSAVPGSLWVAGDCHELVST